MHKQLGFAAQMLIHESSEPGKMPTMYIAGHHAFLLIQSLTQKQAEHNGEKCCNIKLQVPASKWCQML